VVQTSLEVKNRAVELDTNVDRSRVPPDLTIN
jgi:hypothetical protein